MSKTHIVKSWLHLFEPIWDGRKTHDLRVMDRGYKIGDKIQLHEYDWVSKKYTGRYVLAEITYITSHNDVQCAFSPFVLDNRFGILSLKVIDRGFDGLIL